MNKRWYKALNTLLDVLTAQTKPTFNPETGEFWPNEYTFQRRTTARHGNAEPQWHREPT